MARLKSWFFGLEERERWIVGVGAVVAAAIIIWGLGVRPMRAELARLRTAVDTKQRLLVEVARVEVAQPASVAGNRQGANQTINVILDTTARSYGIGQQRMRNNGPSTVDVTLQGVPFDALVAWLVALHGTYGIDVETASFSSGRETGLVNGQVSLHRL
ncbi:MAG TPA: type II secretion system protein GspM [Gammaproteobacteria bacterium]|nr:type II secretion system protein GspM [Gammaproteobacteria bacterium]